MAKVPHSTRRIPVPVAAAEVILTVPRPISLGGDGWGALHATANGGSATTVTFLNSAVLFNDFEAAILTATNSADRLNGCRVKLNGRTTVITDYSNDATTGTITFASGAIPAGASGQDLWVEADFPLYISYLAMKPAAAAGPPSLQYNTTNQAGLITAGLFKTIAGATTEGATQTDIIIDQPNGTPSFPIRLAGSAAATAEFVVYVP